jgi:hypothetical protein
VVAQPKSSAKSPAAKLSRLEPHEQGVRSGDRLHVRRRALGAEVAKSHRLERFEAAARDETRLTAHLDSPVRRFVLVDDDACPRVALQMLHLDVARIDRDIEPAVPPLMPDRGEQDAAVHAIRGQDGDERLLEQVAQILGAEVLVHGASLRRSTRRL